MAYTNAEAYTGEIRMFGGDYAPPGWALCLGQTLVAAEYQALFSLLGARFGGDGRTTFALPNMVGRVPVHQGSAPGLTPRILGQTFGEDKVTLSETQIPVHNHPMVVSQNTANSNVSTNRLLASLDQSTVLYTDSYDEEKLRKISGVQEIGGGVSHDNCQPNLSISFMICLNGEYPQRN